MGVLYKKDGVQIVSTSNSFQTTIHWLKEEIPGKIKENNIPGLSITLVTKDEVIFSQGFGYTHQDKAQEVNGDTLLGLQSTSKTFTAIGFLRPLCRVFFKSFKIYHEMHLTVFVVNLLTATIREKLTTHGSG